MSKGCTRPPLIYNVLFVVKNCWGVVFPTVAEAPVFNPHSRDLEVLIYVAIALVIIPKLIYDSFIYVIHTEGGVRVAYESILDRMTQ